MAQQTPVAADPGACARGTVWHAVMPDDTIVTMACPGHQGAVTGASEEGAASVADDRADDRAARTAAEPLYTGSIGERRTEAPESRSLMVDGPQDCRPGAFWLMSNPNNDTPVACP